MKMNIVRPTHPPLGGFVTDFEECLKTGNVTNGGRHVQAFEAALTRMLGVPTIVFSSGQAALMTMLAAAGISSGEVITSSFTFCATPHAVKWVGAEPVFADIDPETLCLDPESVRGAINGKTRAILAVDPYGLLCDTAALDKIAGGLPIYIDSAPSFGSVSLLSRVCDAQIFSFHATKALSCMEGGALSSNDAGLIERAKQIRNFGQDSTGDCAMPGLNGKMLEVCAMIGLRQLDLWPQVRAWRRQFVTEITEALADIPGLTIIRAPEGQFPVWLYIPVLIDEERFGMSRDAFADQMKNKGIGARTYYRPCHKLACYSHRQVSLPITERVGAQVVALPVYNDMLPSEIDRLCETIREIQKDGAR